MKKLIIAFVFCSGLHLGISTLKAQNVSVSFQLFYDELSPYGMWIDNPDYGYVWVPDVGRNFEPYSSDGYWAYTDAGWTWVSNYPWGWGPFHYGRWYYDNFYGYVWVPGNQWGPAWVNWRYCNGYYGWTALGPGYGYGYGQSYTSFTAPAERWIFVRERDFGRTNIHNYYVGRSDNVTIINKSTVINNSIANQGRNENYIAGPAREQVQKVTGKPVKAFRIQDNAKPGNSVNSSQVALYRPKLENSMQTKPAPSKIASPDESKKFVDKRIQQNSSALPNSEQEKIKNASSGSNSIKKNNLLNATPANRLNDNIRNAKPSYNKVTPPNGNTQQRMPGNIRQDVQPREMKRDPMAPPTNTPPSKGFRQTRPGNVSPQGSPIQERKPDMQMQRAPQRDFQRMPNNQPMRQAPQSMPAAPPQMQRSAPVKPSMQQRRNGPR